MMVAVVTGARSAMMTRKREHARIVERIRMRNVPTTVLVTGLSSDYRPTVLPPWYRGPVVTG